MADHLSEEELKSDALIDASAKSIEYIQNNRNSLIAALVAVVVLIAAVLGYNYWSQKQEIKAQQLLAKAEQLFENEGYEQALNGDDINFVMGFDEIHNSFGSTKAGNLAAYYAAVCAFEIGESDRAISYINSFDVPKGILGVSPLNLHASILEQEGQLEEAATMYMKAANWVKNDATTPFNMLEAAEAYVAANNSEKAVSILESIVKDYADAPQVTSAKRLIGQLKG